MNSVTDENQGDAAQFISAMLLSSSRPDPGPSPEVTFDANTADQHHGHRPWDADPAISMLAAW
jgi:hypothetical protein